MLSDASIPVVEVVIYLATNMNHVVELKGTVLECNLIGEGKSFIHLYPDDPNAYFDIESRAGQLKNEHPLDPALNSKYHHEMHSIDFIEFKDNLFDDCCVIFESTKTPTIKGEFREFEHNDEFIYKRARILGALHRFKSGNVGINFHIVEDEPELATAFEIEMQDVTESLDDEDWYD